MVEIPTSLQSRLQKLANGTDSGGIIHTTTSLSALRAQLATSTSQTSQGSSIRLDGAQEEDTISLSFPTLWDDLLHEAEQIEFDDFHAPPAAPIAVSKDVTATTPARRLLNHLAAVYSDNVLSQSVLDSVMASLQSQSSDEVISVALAEQLGFEHLDLVADLVSDRQAVLADIQTQQLQTTENVSNPFSLTTSNARHDVHSTARVPAKPYTPGAQVKIQTQEDIAMAKLARQELRRAHRGVRDARYDEGSNGVYTADELAVMRESELESNAHRPLYSSSNVTADQPQYPHVFTSHAGGNTLSAMGQKFALPAGTTRHIQSYYEEVSIPPPRQVPMRFNERLIPISDMDPLCRGAFPGYKTLNRLQSVVYPLGYGTNENLLVCAPTGAGKTDVAMLTVLRAIAQHTQNFDASGGTTRKDFLINKNDFKIIYVAPMKALAAEIVRKFGKRLAYLGIKVRELTGDMQMTRQEIADTQMIVTTPEKWDVVTRKPTGEGELAQRVKLLIIDEVHLLHEERGAVIETIVARTLRLVESSQSLIRIVGLSATLPNYVDVADFLRVNRYQGLFYFDSSFRPVPLQQHFIGVKGKAGSPQCRSNLDKATFEKVSQLVQDGHQVMVFVHARKETVKTAISLRESFVAEGLADSLTDKSSEEQNGDSKITAFRRELHLSRNRELKELADAGFGIHHAGMLRSDRNLSERMFEAGVTKVLCCTATLAWGVNLPAYAVLIKGTDVYDSSVGKFVDLSILDVLQIFGRAGRPQYEDLGVGHICTSLEKLPHYVDAITSQHPIESKFIGGLIDSLNAEVALGTVNSVQDGVSWLGYTYLHTRMQRNPLMYGMPRDEVEDDPHLGAKRLQLIMDGAKALIAAKMMEHNIETGALSVTDLGRIAARYYIPRATIEVFNDKLRPSMTEADVLNILSLATDFAQIVMRDTEEQELKKMLEVHCPCDVPMALESSSGKVNILLQAYISKAYVEDFALVSDSAYVAQNAGRIIRSLVEIALSKKWATTTATLMSMSCSIERRMWSFSHPLVQSGLPTDVTYNLGRHAEEKEVSDLARMSAASIGSLIRMNERLGALVRKAAKEFPALQTSYSLRPLARNLLRVAVKVTRSFEWNEKLHGGMEPFCIWIEDAEGMNILQWANVVIRPNTSEQSLVFDTVLPEDVQWEGISVRSIAEHWLSADLVEWVPFDDLILPAPPAPHTLLLDLPLLSISALQNETLEGVYGSSFMAFSAIQTQVFHAMMHTSSDVLLCAPAASGKSTLTEVAIWRAVRDRSDASILVVHPRPSLSRHRADAFTRLFAGPLQLLVRSVRTGSELDSVTRSGIGQASIYFASHYVLAEALATSSSIADMFDLIIVEDVHYLEPYYELALTHLQAVRNVEQTRLIATSSSLIDASGLAAWLGIKEQAVYSFHPKDRPSPLTLTLKGFDIPHSLSLLKAMVKPVYDKIKGCSRKGSSIVFVPSRLQCQTVAQDLVRSSGADIDVEPFMCAVSTYDMESYLVHLEDKTLYEPLAHGIGICMDGMSARDHKLTVRLFEQGIIRVLVASRDACWNMRARAHLVCIMGTQYVRLIQSGTSEPGNAPSAPAERKVTDYQLTELVRMQSFAVRPSTAFEVHPPGECLVLCQSSQAPYLQRMLSSGLPLESSLCEDGERALLPFICREIKAGRLISRQEAVEFMSWTYLYRRMQVNPSFYDCLTTGEASISSRLSDLVDHIFDSLLRVACIVAEPARQDLPPTYRVTELARALERQRNDKIVTLLKLRDRVTVEPNALVPFLAEMRKRHHEKSGSSQTSRLVHSLLEDAMVGVQGDLLAAANIPRLDKKRRKLINAAIKSKQKANEGCESVNGTASVASGSGPSSPETSVVSLPSEPAAHFTAAQKLVLLLVLALASKPLQSVQVTPGSALSELPEDTLRDLDTIKQQLDGEQRQALLELLNIYEASVSNSFQGSKRRG